MANAGQRKHGAKGLRRAAPGTALTTVLQAAAPEPPRHQHCALCLELYKSPRILPCFHTFCLACLEQLVWSNSAAASFPCPTCRTAVQIPSGGVGKFQVNFYVEAAMENLQISQGGIHVCDMCGAGNASSKCVDCDQFACDNCSKVHARIGTTKSHTVLNLNAQSPNARVIKERFCTTHTDEKIRFFCTECKTVLCRDCKLTSHEGHSTMDLSQRSQKAKELLLDVAKKSRNMTPKLKKSLQKAEKREKDLAINKTQILATFRKRADEIRKTIDSCLQQAEQNLSSESGKLEKELSQTVEDMQQQIASLESLCDHLEQVARVGCDADILSLPEQMVKFFGCARPMQSVAVTFLQCQQELKMRREITSPFPVFTNETWCKNLQLENSSTHQQVNYYHLGYSTPQTGDLKGMISEKIGKVSVISDGHNEPLYSQQDPFAVLAATAKGFNHVQQEPQTGTISQDIADIQSVISQWLTM